MDRISVFSSRKVCPLPPPDVEPKAPPEVVPRTRTFTEPPLRRATWTIPLWQQQHLPYTPDELEELYLRREEEAQVARLMYEGDSDHELLQAILEEPDCYERCDECDTLFEVDHSRRCPSCGWRL